MQKAKARCNLTWDFHALYRDWAIRRNFSHFSKFLRKIIFHKYNSKKKTIFTYLQLVFNQFAPSSSVSTRLTVWVREGSRCKLMNKDLQFCMWSYHPASLLSLIFLGLGYMQNDTLTGALILLHHPTPVNFQKGLVQVGVGELDANWSTTRCTLHLPL